MNENPVKVNENIRKVNETKIPAIIPQKSSGKILTYNTKGVKLH